MTFMRSGLDRVGVLGVVVSVGVACTPLAGVAPTDARVADVVGVRDVDGPRVCPPPTPGHASGERDLTLRDLVDPRLADFYIKGAAQDALGRIYAYGAMFGCHGPGGPTDIAVARFTEDGTLDPSFGVRGIACTRREAGDTLHSAPFALAVDDRGRVVAAGLQYINLMDYHPDALVARFDARGQPDETFGGVGFRRLSIGLTPGAPRSSSLFVLAEADGIVVAGAERDPFNDGMYDDAYAFVTRLREDGAPDPSFHGGAAHIDSLSWSFASVARTPRGYAVAGTSRPGYCPQIVVFGRDGERVAGFGTDGVATHTRCGLQVRGLELDARGGFVMAGATRITQKTALVRLTSDGQVDRDFGLDSGLTELDVPWVPGFQLDPVLTRQCDGRLLVVGNAGESGFTIARLGTDGRPDPLFGTEGFVRVGSVAGSRGLHVYAVLVHPRDGRITVVSSWNNDRDVALWRFWP
mgnify:CR=1 FL=1